MAFERPSPYRRGEALSFEGAKTVPEYHRIALFKFQSIRVLRTHQYSVSHGGVARVEVLMNVTVELLPTTRDDAKRIRRHVSLRQVHCLEMSFPVRCGKF